MKTTLKIEVEFDEEVTDAECVASALDQLMETALSTPGILGDCGNPHIGEFGEFVVSEGSDWMEFQRDRAKASGKLEDYDHHLGMVEKPLPFELWKLKSDLLERYLKADPNGTNEFLDRKINELCLQLGV